MELSGAHRVTLCAVFAALIALFSWISFPIGPVPINLALFAVLLCGGVLGGKTAIAAVGVYILLGAVGVPVFSGFSGGISRLLGPTGGYILGYLPAAYLAGMSQDDKSVRQGMHRILLMTLGVISCYFSGSLWFSVLRKASIWDTLCLCVFPFLPGDALKAAAAAGIVPHINRIVRKM